MPFKKKQTPPTIRQRNHDTARGPSVNYSYHARRSDQSANTGRVGSPDGTAAVKRIGQFWARQFGLALFVIVAIIGFFVLVGVSTTPTVRIDATSSATYLLPAEEYEAAATKILARSLLNRNKITVNTAELHAEMLKQFPELADVAISVPLVSHTLGLELIPSEPSLVLTASNGSYVISESGRALGKGSALPANPLKLPPVVDQSDLSVTIGDETLSRGDVAFILTVAKQLEAKKLPIGSLTLPSKARQLDVGIAGQPYYVKFNLQRSDPARQAGAFLAVQANLTGQKIVPASYVDVRVEGRAYYK